MKRDWIATVAVTNTTAGHRPVRRALIVRERSASAAAVAAAVAAAQRWRPMLTDVESVQLAERAPESRRSAAIRAW